MQHHIEIINSIKDPRVIEARSLNKTSARKINKLALIEGKEAFEWALQRKMVIKCLFLTEKEAASEWAKQFVNLSIPIYVVSEGILKKITETNYLIPVVSVVYVSQVDIDDPFIVVLDQVKDFGNIGTIVRTAQAFGVSQFISTDEQCDFFYKKTIESSRGTVFSSHLNNFQSPELALKFLKENDYYILATSPYGKGNQAFLQLPSKKIALVLGNETHGVSPEIMQQSDRVIRIPMLNQLESFNVGVAAGISLYEVSLKVIISMLTKKIENSLGRNLNVCGRWLRKLFDQKLASETSLNADQAILLMVLHCDQTSSIDKLMKDVGSFADAEILIQPLIDLGLVQKEKDCLRITESGQTTLAKVWYIHEEVEELVLQGLSNDEKDLLQKALDTIQKNCQKITSFD